MKLEKKSNLSFLFILSLYLSLSVSSFLLLKHHINTKTCIHALTSLGVRLLHRREKRGHGSTPGAH